MNKKRAIVIGSAVLALLVVIFVVAFICHKKALRDNSASASDTDDGNWTEIYDVQPVK